MRSRNQLRIVVMAQQKKSCRPRATLHIDTTNARRMSLINGLPGDLRSGVCLLLGNPVAVPDRRVVGQRPRERCRK
jgi:hypothetical protein